LAKRQARDLLPVLVAVGGVCGLAITPASALELGEITIESSLGQPLRASIAYALNPNEQLYDFCIYLRPGAIDAAIPSVSRARVSITDGAIILTGTTAIRDPLLNVRVAVDCPYTPNLVREYTLIVDPVLPDSGTRFAASGNVVPVAKPQTAARPARAASAASAAATRSTPGTAPPISASTEYRVRTGDSISSIAARIEGRTIGLWPAINALVAANPDAFVDNDANRLMAGSVLTIPNMYGDFTAPEIPATPTVAEFVETEIVVPTAPVEDIPTVESPLPVFEPVTESVDSATEFAPVEPVVVVDITATDDVVVEERAVVDGTIVVPAKPELRPGDVIVSPLAATSSDVAVVQAPSVSSGNAATSATSGAWSRLIWLGGSGITLILGLLFFGRTLRQRFGSIAVGAAQVPAIEPEEEPTVTNPLINDVDFEFEFDDAIPADAISLDADLDAGTGLQDNAEMDVAQDFGFSATGQVENKIDHEITEEAAREPEEQPTDIIQPSHRIEESSILESEVISDDEDYDMSMIVDATKQSLDEFDATAKDLHAVQVKSGGDGEYMVSDDTLNRDVDLEILEQDYQEEFTATQALNQEIEKAAAELALRMHDMDEAVAETPALEDDLELTAEMPARPKDLDITAELTANISMDIEAVNDDEVIDEHITSKMVVAGSDITVEMQVESGKIDTKKKT
jgi:hypothetical protein